MGETPPTDDVSRLFLCLLIIPEGQVIRRTSSFLSGGTAGGGDGEDGISLSPLTFSGEKPLPTGGELADISGNTVSASGTLDGRRLRLGT